MQLSICMMVKNEEKNLERCLRSLQPLREAVNSELIIIDTGSTDRTVEIAKRFTYQLYFHQWTNSFAEMRNKTISYAKGDWILIIDADEEVVDAVPIIKFLKSKDARLYGSAAVSVISLITEETDALKGVLVSPRLFKNGFVRYEGSVHNQPKFKGKSLALEASFLHYGYLITDKELMDRKFLRTSSLLKAELEQDPGSIYYRYQLSNSYKMHGDIKPALVEILKAYELLQQQLNRRSYIYVYYQLVICLIDNGKYEEAEPKCIEGLQLEPEHIDLYFCLAQMEVKFGKTDSAIEHYETFLKLAPNYQNLAARLDLVFLTAGRVEEVNYELAMLRLQKGEYEKCLDNLHRVEAKEFAPKVIPVKVQLFFSWGKLDELKHYYQETVAQGNPSKTAVLAALEAQKKQLQPDERLVYLQVFADGPTEYELLNGIRLAFSAGDPATGNKIAGLVQEVDMNTCPTFFADVLYFLMRLNRPLGDVFFNTSENTFSNFVNYLKDEYEDFQQVVSGYLKDCMPPEGVAEARVHKVLVRYLLLTGKLPEAEYKSAFLNYVRDGILSAKKIYSGYILQGENVALLNDQEARFFVYMAQAEEKRTVSEADYVRYLRKALRAYPATSKGIEMLLADLRQRQREQEEFEKHRVEVQKAISNFIGQGQLQEAMQVISEYEQIVSQDIQVQSMKAVILILEGNLGKAASVLQEALKTEPKDFDLLYNLAYVYQHLGQGEQAVKTYELAKESCVDPKLLQEIEVALSSLASLLSQQTGRDKPKLVFFVKPGMDSFLDDIIAGLSAEYETRKIVVTEYTQVDDGMKWADICWFEWCDELVIYGSKHALASAKKMICRIHGYEVYGDNILNVDWRNMDKLIIVAPHIKRIFEERTREINKGSLTVDLVFCGVNLEKYPFQKKSKGYNIGYLGFINFKKNIPLTLEIFHKLHKLSKKYRLFIAGQFQDARTVEYFKFFINEHHLQDFIFFEGWKSYQQKIEWFKKINYMLISSIDEGLCYAAAESMCTGIKPILHRCEGIVDHYSKKYIFDDIDEAVAMIMADNYNSLEYRNFIQANYSLHSELHSIKYILTSEMSRGGVKLLL